MDIGEECLTNWLTNPRVESAIEYETYDSTRRVARASSIIVGSYRRRADVTSSLYWNF